eukprot:5820480-Amphidinium_carterae.2
MLIAWALVNKYEIRTGDFSVAFMFTPVPEYIHSTWRHHQKQDHLATILRSGGFEQSKAEKCLFMHRKLQVIVTAHVDDPIVANK